MADDWMRLHINRDGTLWEGNDLGDAARWATTGPHWSSAIGVANRSIIRAEDKDPNGGPYFAAIKTAAGEKCCFARTGTVIPDNLDEA